MVSANRTVEKETRKSVKQRRLEKRKAARVEAHRQRVNRDDILIEFQPDAVELEQRSVAGGARYVLYVSIAFMIAAISWSYWAQVDKIVVGQGKLINVEPPVVIQTSLAAPIHSLTARFGDRVRSGDILATLDPTFPEADLADLNAKLKAYDASIARLTAERNSIPFTIEGHENDTDWMMQLQNYTERKNEYRAKMKEFESEEVKLAVQSGNNKSQITQLKKNLETYQAMEEVYVGLRKKGSASDVDVYSRQLQTRDAEGKLREAQGRSEEIVAEENTLDKRRIAFTANWRAEVVAELIEHHQQRNSILQNIKKYNKMNESVEIKVPENGEPQDYFVFEVADRSPGSVSKEGEALFKLIPEKSKMEVEIEVQGKDIALISKGSEVKVKLNSFPYQKHGTLLGTVSKISEGSFEKEGPNGATASTFKVIVQLDESVKLDNLSDDIRLMPGMTTVAEIKVGKRRVIEYFLYPLLRHLDDSIREP